MFCLGFGIGAVIITVRKRSVRRLCFYTCLSFCPQGGLQAHIKGRLRGLAGGVSRPIPRGEVERSGWGGGIQAHTQGEVEGFGGGAPDSYPGGRLRGLARVGSPGPGPGWSRPRWEVYPSMH